MRGRLLLLIGLLSTVAFAGCVSDEEGSVSFYVKDAPTDEFSEIHVVFTDVLVHAAGDGDDNETDDNGTDDGGWETVFHNASGVDVDLLAASGDASAFLGEANLTAGKYTQIRIVTSGAYGIDHDGNRIDFTVPSGVLKIPHPFDVNGGEETKITVDYNLDRSLVKTGPNGWKMTPVIGQTIVEHVEDDEAGEEVAEEGEIVE